MHVRNRKNKNLFVVIDGSALLCTQYYGSLPDEVKIAKTPEEKELHYDKIAQTKDGIYTNGVCGYLQVLLEILHEHNPSHMAVCFDKSRQGTFRREMYPEYKGQRSETPAPLSQQMKLAQEITKELGIPVLMSDKYEADDYAGTLAKTFEKEKPVVLLTKDRDYFQLISENVHGWIIQSPSKIEALTSKYGESLPCITDCYEYTPDTVFSEIGVQVNQIADWKGLSGDPSDNIPGVRGVADKSAIPLLKEYGTLENIYAALDACKTEEELQNLSKIWKNNLGITRPPIKALLEGRKQAALSKCLATIKTDVDIDKNLEHYTAHVSFNQLRDIAHTYEMTPLVRVLDMYIDVEEYITEQTGHKIETEFSDLENELDL